MNVFVRVLLAIAWLVVCWLAFVFFAFPLILSAFAIGLMVGSLVTGWGYMRIFAGYEDEAILIAPSPDLARRADAPYPMWDYAWSNYLSWQVERDIYAATAWPSGMVSGLWVKAKELAVPHRKELLAVFPLAAAPVGFLVGVTVGAAVGWLAFGTAIELVFIVPRAGRLLAIVVLRGADGAIRWCLGAAATCPTCHSVTWLPAYHCKGSNCRVLHRDVRPGRLGVWLRRCSCGELAPTTVILSVYSKSTPVCPACSRSLHKQAGVAHDARIAVSGSPAAGKTQLLMCAIGQITSTASSEPQWEPADQRSAKLLNFARSTMASWPSSGPETTKNPVLVTFRRCVGRRMHYFNLIDIPGRHFETDASHPALWSLGASCRHVFALDGTTIPWVRDRLTEDSRPALNEMEVERPYRLLVAQLGRLGVQAHRCSLAIVVTHADVLDAEGLISNEIIGGPTSGQLKKWLQAKGMFHLVAAAENDFAEVRYFLAGCSGDDSLAPFAWLLGQHRYGAGMP